MGLQLVTAPTVEPFELSDAKVHLKIDHTDEDSYVTSLIVAARQWAEENTHRQFLRATWQLTVDAFPGWYCRQGGYSTAAYYAAIRLPRPRLIDVTSVTYVDTSGTTQTLSASDYRVDVTQEPGLIVPKLNTFWPNVALVPSAVTVTYRSGYGTAATTVPQAIKEAMYLIMGQWYEFRENVIAGVIPTQVPEAARALLAPYRVMEYK